MKNAIREVLTCYGQTVTIRRGEDTTPVRAFFAPVTSKSMDAMRRAVCGIGEIPAGMFLYIGPPDEDIMTADLLTCGGQCYLPRRGEILRLGDENLYTWGLAVPAGEEETWTRS